MSQEAPQFDSSVTDITPRPSDRLVRQPSLRTRIAAVGISLATLGGGIGFASLASSGTTRAQGATEAPSSGEPSFPIPSGEPSALPTDPPLTGLLPCPSPTPEVSPSPSPTPVIIAFVNNEGQNVTVSLDQELPSAPPSVEPGTSPTPDPETAVIDPCEPVEELPTANEFVDSMIDQTLGEQGTIEKKSYTDVEKKVLAVWNTYKDLLSNMEIPDYGGDKFTEEFINDYLKLLRKGRPEPGESKEHIKSQRMGFAAGFSIMAISATNKTENPLLKKDLYDLANISYYYGIWLNAFGDLERSKEYVDDIIIVSSQAILNYTPSVDQK